MCTSTRGTGSHSGRPETTRERVGISPPSATVEMATRILVTGASGLVGKRLCAALRAAGAELFMPDRDALNRGLERAPPVDKVFHLAARTFVPDSWKEPAEFYRVNVQGTLDVLEYCRRANA